MDECKPIQRVDDRAAKRPQRTTLREYEAKTRNRVDDGRDRESPRGASAVNYRLDRHVMDDRRPLCAVDAQQIAKCAELTHRVEAAARQSDRMRANAETFELRLAGP